MSASLRVIQRLVDKHPRDAARLVATFPEEEAAQLLSRLPSVTSAKLLEHVDPFTAARALDLAPSASAAEIAEALPMRVATTILRRLDPVPRDSVLAALPSRHAARFRKLIKFSPGTAGSLMEPDALSIHEDATAADALERVREAPSHLVHYLYVTDGSLLKGSLSLRQVVSARADASVASMMTTRLAQLRPHQTLDAILAHTAWRQLVAMPVVDEAGLLLGALRYSTVRAVEAELTQRERPQMNPPTGRALAELFGLAVSGALEWPTTLLGADEEERP